MVMGRGWMASIRYLVHDVDQAIALYTGHLGFSLEPRSAVPSPE